MKLGTNQRGFTLVELLVVVAIIGVLATIGIPTFRLMVQKAKKSEARVALAGIYTAEAAFFSEYGGYGNNLDKIGFSMEGNATSRIFLVGFPQANCAAPTATKPLSTTTVGGQINTAYPAYYSGTPVYQISGNRLPTLCSAGSVADDGSTFVASASGLISPNASTAEPDIWTIDNNRTLANTRDGVK